MFWAQFPEIQRELDKVQAVILREVSGAGGTVAAALRDLATRDAKLLRPGCTILAARIQTGGRAADDRIIRIAAAVEMLHMASLVHDDIVDNAERRRGGEAVHITYGSRNAVLMGDYLFARCFSLMADDASPENAAALSKVVSHVISSEIEESGQSGDHTSVRAYLRRIVGKTAILFALSFHLGAAEARGEEAPDSRTVEILRRVGYCIGMSFQILDDLLDLFGDTRRTGKPIGTDIRQGIITLPVILALDYGRHVRLSGLLARLARSKRVVGGPIARTISRTAVERVRREVAAAGSDRAARRIAERYSERANREILRLPQSPDRDTLFELTRTLLQRVS